MVVVALYLYKATLDFFLTVLDSVSNKLKLNLYVHDKRIDI